MFFFVHLITLEDQRVWRVSTVSFIVTTYLFYLYFLLLFRYANCCMIVKQIFFLSWDLELIFFCFTYAERLYSFCEGTLLHVYFCQYSYHTVSQTVLIFPFFIKKVWKGLAVIKSFYQHGSACIRVAGNVSSVFRMSYRLRQGVGCHHGFSKLSWTRW